MERHSFPARMVTITTLITSIFLAISYAADITIKTGRQSPIVVTTGDIDISLISQGLVSVECPETQYLNQTGEPQIPWKVITVLLPPNADLDTVSCTVGRSNYQPIEGKFDIEPAPPLGTWDENGNPITIYPADRTIVDGYDTDIYSADQYWPGIGAKIAAKGKMHRWQLVEVAVPMILYNPVTGAIEELIDADVTVDFERKAAGKRIRQFRGKGRKRARKLAANFNIAAAEYDSQTQPLEMQTTDDTDIYASADESSTGYVIITTNSIQSSSNKLNDFVTHKQSRGWNVLIATESAWGGGTGETAYNNIKTWIENNYVSNDILYVLLIGRPETDTGTVPMRWFEDRTDDPAPTDLFYSSFTGDKYWEVVVGRIPYYGSISDLDNILQKSIDYENTINIEWRRDMLLAMARLDNDPGTPSYQCGEQIKTDHLDPQAINSDRLYEQDFGVGPEFTYPATYMATQWANHSYGMVFWVTHGSQTSAQHLINTGNVSSLNDNYPAATYQGSCQNAWPENSGNLAYRILKNGGITTVAATRNSWYNPGETDYTSGGSIGALAYKYADELTDNKSCGLAWANAKENGYIIYANLTRMLLYGDPSISITIFDIPTTPKNLVAFPDCNMITLNWDDNPESNFDYYNVYSSVSSGGPYSLLASNVPDSNYTDTTVINGTPVYYVITAVDTDADESEYSNQAYATPANDEYLYYDDFSSLAGSNLNNKNPDISYTGASWLAGNDFDADGSVDYDDSSDGDSAYLPFVPVDGKVYTLSATIDTTLGRTGGENNWIGIGFTEDDALPEQAFCDDGVTNNPIYWAMSRTDQATAGNYDRNYLGPGLAGSQDSFEVSQDNIKIVLDTTGILWVVKFYYNGILDRTVQVAYDHDMFQYIALSNSGANGTISNFSLFRENQLNTAPPLAPADLSASLGNGQIDLKWQANTEPDFKSYNIYRSTVKDGPYSKIAAGVLSNSYPDNNGIDDVKCYYAISSVDNADNESGMSAYDSIYHISGDFSFDKVVDMFDMSALGDGWQSIYDINSLASLSETWLTETYLITYLPFDMDANDLSWNQFEGIAHGNVSWNPSGYIDGAVELDGSASYIEIPDFYGITGTNSRTCCLWIKTGYNLSHILTWGNSVTGGKWVIQVDLLGHLQLDVSGGTATSTVTVDNLQWHHIAVVLDNDGTPNLNEIQLYIDGQPVIVNASDLPIDTGSSEQVKIGVYSPDPKYYNGLIDEVLIYDRALSSEEIEVLAQ